MAAIRSSRALSSLARQPRHRSDQSGLPEGTVEEGTIILGRQPDEEPEPAPEEPPTP